MTLTATVVSGIDAGKPRSGQVLRCVGQVLRGLGPARNGAIDPRRDAMYNFRPGIGSHSYQAVFVGTKAMRRAFD